MIIFPIGPFNLSPRFWEPVCNYTWQPHVLNTEASRYPTIFFYCCIRLHIKSMNGGYQGLGRFIPTGIRPLCRIIAILHTYLYTISILCFLPEAFHNWLIDGKCKWLSVFYCIEIKWLNSIHVIKSSFIKFIFQLMFLWILKQHISHILNFLRTFAVADV